MLRAIIAKHNSKNVEVYFHIGYINQAQTTLGKWTQGHIQMQMGQKQRGEWCSEEIYIELCDGH